MGGKLTKEEAIAAGLPVEGMYDEAEAPKPVAAPALKPGPSVGHSALLGAASGIPIIGGLMDEATGLTHAAYGKTLGDSKEPFWDVYRQERDLYRKEEDEAAKENPKAFYGSGLASGLLSGGALGPSGATLKALSIPAKYGLAAGIGGADALARSRDDLTKGEVIGAGRDAATGAALGVGAQYVGDKLAKLPSWLGDKFKAMADENKAKIAEAAAKKATETTRSAIGAAGGRAVGEISADDKMMALKAAGFPGLTPENIAKVEEYLADAATVANRNRMVANKLAAIPHQRAIANEAVDAMEQAIETQPERIAKYIAEHEGMGISGVVAPRIKTDISRWVPHAVGLPVGLAVGQFLGSPTLGSIVGAAAGAGLSSTLGARGTAWANAMRSPELRLGAANLGMSATGALEGALRKAAQGATPTLQASPLGKYLLDEDEAKENFKKNGG